MAVKKHGVHFDVTAENATDRALQAVEANLGRIDKAALAVGKTLGGAFLATAAIAGGKAIADAAMEAEQASKRLDAVLKATAGAAGLAKRELDELADSLAETTQFDDESLRNGMAQLLKFGNVHGQVFRDAIKLSADLAAFMGTDVTTAVQAVGKALTSPDEGLGALERQVGKFDSAMRAAIKTQVDMGNQTRAQAMVLDLLKGKVGGAAEAMNTGLTRSVNDLKKSWGEMLEAIGKTSPVQGTAGGTLQVLNNYLRNIKDTIENGDWVEKTLAILALAGGAGGHRPFNLSKAPEAAPNVSSGRIRGAPGTMSLDNELTGFPMTEAQTKEWKETQELRKRAAEEAARLREKQLRTAQEVAEKQVELEEIASDDTRAAWEAYTKQRLEQEAEIKKAREEGLKAWFETIDREQEAAIEAGEAFLDAERERKEALKESEQAARDLGLTLTSAFEDAVLEGKKMSDVLKSLGKDIGRIFLRETITKPIGVEATNLFKGINWGSLFSGGAGGGVSDIPAFATGTDYVPRDMLAMVHQGEKIIPAGKNRGGGNTFVIDARGADRQGMAELRRMIIALDASLEERSVGAVFRERQRGGSFAAAFNG